MKINEYSHCTIVTLLKQLLHRVFGDVYPATVYNKFGIFRMMKAAVFCLPIRYRLSWHVAALASTKNIWLRRLISSVATCLWAFLHTSSDFEWIGLLQVAKWLSLCLVHALMQTSLYKTVCRFLFTTHLQSLLARRCLHLRTFANFRLQHPLWRRRPMFGPTDPGFCGQYHQFHIYPKHYRGIWYDGFNWGHR